MRMLFTFAGGAGHFIPLVPVARAAVAAGHIVAVAGAPALVTTVEAAGFPAIPTGTEQTGTPSRMPLLDLDPDREDRDFRDYFAGRLARERAAALLDVCAGWRPDLVVCDETDFGAMVAAERLGVPYASVVVLAAGTFAPKTLITGNLNLLRAEHGLPPDPELSMVDRHLVLSPVPASYRAPSAPLPATAVFFRPDPPAPTEAPDWLTRRPAVYVTLGTVFNLESGDLFSRVLDGLRDLDAAVVATVGPYLDPAELGPQPDNVHIGQFIPQDTILPHVDVVVSHAGSGSVLGALAYGRPMVLVPMGADQPANAARCEDLGVARVLDAVAATPHDVRAAVTDLLADPGYRRNAERLRDEFVAMPGAAHAVAALERLVTARPAAR